MSLLIFDITSDIRGETSCILRVSNKSEPEAAHKNISQDREHGRYFNREI
jgi:hypothetical protein